MGLINMISILALSCLVVLPAVLANDPPCTRCCNVESTVVESALRLVQCEKGALNCPEEQNLVDDYLPEYVRCLIKSKNRAAGRDGRSMQFICGFLLLIFVPSFVGPGVTRGLILIARGLILIARGLMLIAMRLIMIAMRLMTMAMRLMTIATLLTMIAMRLRMKVMALKRRMRTKRRMKRKRKRKKRKRWRKRKRSKMRSKKLLSITVLL